MISTGQAPIQRIQGNSSQTLTDALAVEEPLEIRAAYGPAGARVRKSISITMRTQGHDAELAAGFLFTEGLIRRREDIRSIEPCGGSGNAVRVELDPELALDLGRLERHFYTSSSCGVCGKSSVDALKTVSIFPLPPASPWLASSLVHRLPAALRRSQEVFSATGGLHASALFSAAGQLEAIREDVGRHNALDKLIGWALLEKRLPLAESILLLSGRASFEMMQKAHAAGLSVVAAISAPSSLAVELAKESGQTLVGFLRKQSMNIYAGGARIAARKAAKAR